LTAYTTRAPGHSKNDYYRTGAFTFSMNRYTSIARSNSCAKTGTLAITLGSMIFVFFKVSKGVVVVKILF
jgi:hypothetical protein